MLGFPRHGKAALITARNSRTANNVRVDVLFSRTLAIISKISNGSFQTLNVSFNKPAEEVLLHNNILYLKPSII